MLVGEETNLTKQREELLPSGIFFERDFFKKLKRLWSQRAPRGSRRTEKFCHQRNFLNINNFTELYDKFKPNIIGSCFSVTSMVTFVLL